MYSIKYDKWPAFGVQLNKVPGLMENAKCSICSHLQQMKNEKHNNLQPFSTPELAEKGIVSYQNTTTNIAYMYVHL